MMLIKNANLISMGVINYEIVDVLIEHGKIKALGKFKNKDYPEALVIDAKGNYVTPGLVDPHCHIGLYEEAIKFEGLDVNETTDPISPELRALDAVKPQDGAFKEALKNGVTTVCTGPGSANIIGGTFAVLKTVGKTVEDMIIREESSMKMALGENPKAVYSGKSKAPSTRMATAALLRDALFRARDYKTKIDKYEQDTHDGKEASKPDFNMKLQSLARVFSGLPVKIHAHQQDDIVTAVRIMKEFGLEGTIEHATESHLIVDYLKHNNVKVIIGPTFGSKSKYELRNKTFITAKVLQENNIAFAIMTDHPVIHSSNALTQLGLFVREGLNELEGFRAVSLYAAQLNGIADRVGSIEPGKDADIVIWDNHPLHYLSKTLFVIVNGNIAYGRE